MTSAQAARAVAEILTFSQLVTISNILRVVTADPDDDKIVECAMVGRATHIVSGDRHLLELRVYQGIPIIRAADFLSLVGE
jgi:predicted nucleic acid-binding protein